MISKLLKQLNLMMIFIMVTPSFMLALYVLRFNSLYQLQILYLAAGVYIVLALAHHLKEKTLTWERALEYILIAALSLIILQSTFF